MRISDVLSGGNLNDPSDAPLVLMELSEAPELLPELVSSLRDKDPIVRARASAVLERLTRSAPELAEAAHGEILQLTRGPETWLTRMNVSRMAPLIAWSADEYEEILAFLFKEIERNEGFVSAWALNALARLAVTDESIRSRTMFLLNDAISTGSASVRARAEKALLEIRASLR